VNELYYYYFYRYWKIWNNSSLGKKKTGISDRMHVKSTTMSRM